MEPEIKPLWIDALRSGGFRQGKGMLRCDGRYCCLGVLSELAVRAGVITDAEAFGRHGSNIHLHPDVVKWSGVPRDGWLFDSVCLSDINDNGVPFDGIAGIIEEHL